MKTQKTIYIAAIQETIDRARQDIEARGSLPHFSEICRQKDHCRHICDPSTEISLEMRKRAPMAISTNILQKGRLNPTNGAGDRVVKANGRADMKGMQNVMQAERRSTTTITPVGDCHMYLRYTLTSSNCEIVVEPEDSGSKRTISCRTPGSHHEWFRLYGWLSVEGRGRGCNRLCHFVWGGRQMVESFSVCGIMPS
jgi:hypothetical protein